MENTTRKNRPSNAEVQNAFLTIASALVASEPANAPDELVAFPFNLERTAARKLVQSGELRTRKLGRIRYCRRSDLLALLDKPDLPANDDGAEGSSPEEVYARLARGGK